MAALDVGEIIQNAVRVEKAGAFFYEKMASRVSNPAVKAVFLQLVQDEIRHQKDFAEIMLTLEQKVFEADSSASLSQMFCASAEKIIRNLTGSELLDMEEINVRQAVEMAIRNEKQAIQVYSGMLEIRHSGLSRILLRIIEEEQKHLQLLEAIKLAKMG